MEIAMTVDGSRVTYAPKDKLTVQTASELDKAIVSSFPEDARDLEIDLADVDYVSSSGLRVFVSASKLAMLHGGSFSLLHPRDDVMDVLEVTGMADVFTVVR